MKGNILVIVNTACSFREVYRSEGKSFVQIKKNQILRSSDPLYFIIQCLEALCCEEAALCLDLGFECPKRRDKGEIRVWGVKLQACSLVSHDY